MARKPSKVTTDERPAREGRSAKGELARGKLRRAALDVLEQVGYHRMRIADVTGAAGVAAGLFYHYYSDLKSLTLEVLGDFVAHSLQLDDIERDVPKGDWYERILAHNRLVVAAYAERPGIMRALLQLADEDEDFSRLLHNHFLQQLGWLTRQMPRLFPAAALSEQQSLMVVYTLAGMAEMMLRDYYIKREPALLASELAVDEMAELLSVFFYRGLFLENPPPEKLRYTGNLQAMRKS